MGEEKEKMNDTTRTPVRRFKCERCGTNFHIMRCTNGHYARYMPPAYCPKCGNPTKEEQCAR